MRFEDETVKKVMRSISRYRMINSGDLVVVAVSGGPDSICLLDLLHFYSFNLGIKLVVAHFNHCLRPGEDEEETRFVKDLAEHMGLRFELGKATTGLADGNGSLEEKARNARYLFLEKVRGRYDAQKIAMGHNLNDQAETVLMRLLRGSGPSGLSGIPPVREGVIIRPLIEVTRDEILSHLDHRGVRYMTDSSNMKGDFLRNRIRLNLLPVLKKYQPRIIERLGTTAEIMRTDEEWLEAEAEKWLRRNSDKGGYGEVKIPLPLFLGLHEAIRTRIIRSALKSAGAGLRRINQSHYESVNGLAHKNKAQCRVSLPNGLTVLKIYDKLIFTKEQQENKEDFCYFLEVPGVFCLEKLGCSISLEEEPNDNLYDWNTSSKTAFLDAERLVYPLKIRNFKAGDRFVPLGMKGHRKLKDLFIDLKIPSSARSRIPILTSGNEIVWVCGLRVDERYRVREDSSRVLKAAIVDKL